MPTIGWNESVPSNASKVGTMPPFFRSILTGIETALGTNLLYWSGAGGESIGSIGEMQPGGPRTYYAAFSASSNADNATLGGRLFFASDTSDLYVYDSAGTFRVGTPSLVEAGTLSGSHWVISNTSVQVPNSATSVTVAFPATFSAAPTVRVHPSNADMLVSLSAVTAGGVKSSITVDAGSVSTFTLFVTALGETVSVV